MNIARKKLTKQEVYRKLFPFLCLSIIITLSVFNISKAGTIRIIGDEFGYWTAGAYFSGLHWEPAASLNAYYSYGYGFLLALIIKLNIPSNFYYIAAIILNSIFLCGVFLLIKKFIQDHFPESDELTIYLLSLCATIYPANLLYSQFTMAETLILFLFWLILDLTYSLLKKATIFKGILYIIAITFLYFIHLRTLGIYLSASIIILYILIKNRKKPQYLIWIPFSIILMLFGNHLKNVYQDNYLSYFDNPLLTINDYSGQLGKLNEILSLSGIIKLIKSIIGKLFYAENATFMLAGVGAFNCFILFIKSIKNRAINARVITSLFILLSSLSMIGICSVFMLDYEGRLDLLFYGRYFEFTLMPLFIYGFFYLLNSQKKYKLICISSLFFILISLITCTLTQFESPDSNVFFNIVSLADFYYTKSSIVSFWFYNIARTIILFTVTAFILNLHVNRKTIYPLIIFIVSFIGIFQTVYSKGCLSWGIPSTTTNIALTDYIQQNNLQDQIYYYAGDDKNTSNSSYLQFMLPNVTIPCIKEFDDILKLDKSDLLVTKSGSDIEYWLNKRYRLLASSSLLQLWGQEELIIQPQHIGEEITVDETSLLFSDESTSNDSDYLVYGPYIGLDAGTYEVNFRLESNDEQPNLGFCDISSNNGTEILGINEFNSQELKENSNHIKISFSLTQYTDNIEFRVSDYGTNTVTVKDISYKKIDTKYQLGKDSPKDIEQIVKLLHKDESIKQISYVYDKNNTNISTDYLEEIFPSYKIKLQTFAEIINDSTPKYILMENDSEDWLLLLNYYEVVGLYDNYKVLSPTDCYLSQQIPKKNKLTIGNNISSRLVQTTDEKGFFKNNSISLPSGKYAISLDLLNETDYSEPLKIELYANGNLIINDYFTYSSSIIIPIILDYDISEIKIKVYGEDNSETAFIISDINVLTNSVDYLYGSELGNLLDKLQQLKYHGITILEDTLSNKASSIKKYLALNRLDYVQVKDYFFDLEPWINEANNNQSIILPNKLELIYALIDKGFTLVDANSEYALMYNGTSPIQAPMSAGNTLLKRYFSISDSRTEEEQKIPLPEGIYNVTVDFDYINSDLIKDNSILYLNIYDESELLLSQELEYMDPNISVLISKPGGIQNLRIEILGKNTNTIYASINSIRKESDGYMVNLNKMRATGNINRNEDHGITIHDMKNTTIFGPYDSLKAGSYEIQFHYQMAANAPITFDVTANAGNAVICESESTNTTNTTNTTLRLDIAQDLDDIEFRIHIPASQKFTLESISVIPIQEE